MTRRSLRTSILALATLLPVLLVSVATSQQSDECIDCPVPPSRAEVGQRAGVSASLFGVSIGGLEISFGITLSPAQDIAVTTLCLDCTDSDGTPCPTPATIFHRTPVTFITTAQVELRNGEFETFQRERITTLTGQVSAERNGDPESANFNGTVSSESGFKLGPIRATFNVSVAGVSISSSSVRQSAAPICKCKPRGSAAPPCQDNKPPTIEAPGRITFPATRESKLVSIPIRDPDAPGAVDKGALVPSSVDVEVDGQAINRTVTPSRGGSEDVLFVRFLVPNDADQVTIRATDECDQLITETVPVEVLEPPEVGSLIFGTGGIER